MPHTKIITTLSALLLLAACRTSHKITPTIIHTTDTVTLTSRHYETVSYDTVFIEITPPTEKYSVTIRDTVSLLNTALAESKAAILPDGSLLHTLQNLTDPIKQKAILPSKTTSDTIYISTTHTVPVPYPEIQEVPAKLTAWQTIRISAFWWLFAATSILLSVIIILLRRR